MNTDIVQQLRYKLQKRVRKANSAGYRTFHFTLQRLWQFLHSNEVFVGILEQLAVLVPAARDDAEKILQGGNLHGESEDEEACLAYWVIKACAEANPQRRIETDIAIKYSRARTSDEALELFKDIFVEPLYDYIDEQLDDQRAVLGLLRRYKQSCEWFRRKDLQAIYNSELERSKQASKKSRGEKQLALDLYEYLHNQGLSFSIESWSVSGEADLIAAQNSDDPLIADVKLFDPASGKNKAYILSGFHQIYQYTLDYNEPFGYLVIFKTCEEGLAISSHQQEQSISFTTFNGKSIFFLVIDLFPHDKSASQRGRLKTYTITEEELVTERSNTEEPHETANCNHEKFDLNTPEANDEE